MEMDRTSCVVHTIQLVVHMLQKETTVKRVLDKARSVVKLFRKSSVATQRLLDQCGVIVVNDCPTHWSSTFNMVTRLLTVKDAVCQITNNMGWDSLLTSEWQKLSSLHDLLLPFAEHTKTLQSDTTSMSLVVPALFDLLSHLTDFAKNTRYRDLVTLAEKMRSNLNQRFACLLDSTDEKFSALAAAACFVNPTLCEILVNVDVADGNIQELLKQAEDWSNALSHTQDRRTSLKMMQKKRLLRNQKQRHPQSSRCLGSSQNAAPQGLNRKPPQPASGSRSSSTRKNFHIPSLRTQGQTSGWKRVTVFITV